MMCCRDWLQKKRNILSENWMCHGEDVECGGSASMWCLWCWCPCLLLPRRRYKASQKTLQDCWLTQRRRGTNTPAIAHPPLFWTGIEDDSTAYLKGSQKPKHWCSQVETYCRAMIWSWTSFSTRSAWYSPDASKTYSVPKAVWDWICASLYLWYHPWSLDVYISTF
jgi:hypothetical protein